MRRFATALACATDNLFERQVRMRKEHGARKAGILKGMFRFTLFNP